MINIFLLTIFVKIKLLHEYFLCDNVNNFYHLINIYYFLK